MVFKCITCKIEFLNKSNYNRHLRSKKHIIFKKTQMEDLIEKSAQDNININGYKCARCKFVIKHKSSYYRHVYKTCPLIKDDADDNMLDVLKNVQNELATLKSNISNNQHSTANSHNQIMNHSNNTNNNTNNTNINNTINLINLDYLNKEYADMPSLDSLINHFKNDYQLNAAEADQLYDCSKSDMGSFSKCLWDILQKRFKKLILKKGLRFREIGFPMVTADSNCRSHLEKTDDRWVRAYSDDKIVSIFNICQDQIFVQKLEYPALSKESRQKAVTKFKKHTSKKDDSNKTQEQLFKMLLKQILVVSNEIINIRKQYYILTGIDMSIFNYDKNAIKKLPIASYHKY